MELTQKADLFDTVYADRCDMDHETEYALSEYMPNIQKIVKTDAKIKILDKTTDHDGVTVEGEVVYTVLYISENTGRLKCAVFKEDCSKRFDFPAGETVEAEGTYAYVRADPLFSSAKIAGQRRIAARSKFALSCTVYKITGADGGIEENEAADDDLPECGIEYLRRDITSAELRISEGNPVNLAEEIKIDDDLPEISDIISAEASVCVKNISHTDGMAEVSGELTFRCLYETKNGEASTSEYVSLERMLPFRTEVLLPETDYSWKLIAEASLTALSADTASDNYGEQKIVEVGAGVDVCVKAFRNRTLTVCTDMYATTGRVTPQRQNIRNVSLADCWNGTCDFADRIRFELHGITEIASTSIRLIFSNPELSDGTVTLPARGTLCVLGMKENGEIDAQSAPLNLRIPVDCIPPSLFSGKLRWFNLSTVCRHECEILNGELMLRLWVNLSCAALNEETMEIVCGYEKDGEAGACAKSGFTLYYPQAGESVWNVAKDHAVSCRKLRTENGVEGEFFDGKKAVLLH